MNNFQEKLTCPRIENKDRTIDRFSSQVTLKCLMDGNSINIGIIYKPNHLICE